VWCWAPVGAGRVRQTILVALEPTVRIVHRLLRAPDEVARPGALPCVSWRPLQTRDKDYKGRAARALRLNSTVLCC
jgi:hypothetical protein